MARPGTAPAAVVAGHLSLDVFPAFDGPVTLAPGRLILVGPAVLSTGGVVANTGLALHRLGVGVHLIGKVGPDTFGEAVRRGLREHGAHLADGVTVTPGEVTSYTIVVSPPHTDRSFLHCPGANETFSAGDVPYGRLAGTRLFHFGYPPLMPRMYADGGAQLRTMFERVREAGPVTSLDLCVPDPRSPAGRADWRAVLAGALPFVDVFAPSIDELLYMLDRPAHDRLRAGAPLAAVIGRARLAELAATLIAMGTAVVAIKLGEQGLYLRTSPGPGRLAGMARRLGLDAGAWRAREVLSPCFRAHTQAGTTGSGDTTVAGLLAAMLRGADPVTAATTATAVGACSVEQVDPVSGIPAWPDLRERLASGWPRLPAGLDLGPGAGTRRDPTGTLTFTGGT